MAIAGLAREGSGYAMAIVFVAIAAHDSMAITKAARNAIKQRARQQRGAEIYVRRAGAAPPGQREMRPTSLAELIASAASRPGTDLPIVSLSTRMDPSEFSMDICFMVRWHQYPHEDGSKISFSLRSLHRVPELRGHKYFKVGRAGMVLDQNWETEVTAADINRMIDDFILEPRNHLLAAPLQA